MSGWLGARATPFMDRHPERSEGSVVLRKMQIPRFARDDKIWRIQRRRARCTLRHGLLDDYESSARFPARYRAPGSSRDPETLEVCPAHESGQAAATAQGQAGAPSFLRSFHPHAELV